MNSVQVESIQVQVDGVGTCIAAADFISGVCDKSSLDAQNTITNLLNSKNSDEVTQSGVVTFQVVPPVTQTCGKLGQRAWSKSQKNKGGEQGWRAQSQKNKGGEQGRRARVESEGEASESEGGS